MARDHDAGEHAPKDTVREYARRSYDTMKLIGIAAPTHCTMGDLNLVRPDMLLGEEVQPLPQRGSFGFTTDQINRILSICK